MHYDSKIEQCHGLKAELDAYRPFDADILDQLRRYYRISLTYSSNAIEGNTLTESETKVVLEDGITIGGKPLKDHLEAVGHAKAYDFLYELVKQPEQEIREADLLQLHRMVTEGFDAATPGCYRQKTVIITGTEFIPPKAAEVPPFMDRLIHHKLPDWQQNKDPIETAALSHLELVTIHPFLDGNGRTARLLMNLLFLRSGYGITIIPPVLRNDYIACLRIAQVDGNPQPFINFISHQVYESLKDLLRLVRALKDDYT